MVAMLHKTLLWFPSLLPNKNAADWNIELPGNSQSAPAHSSHTLDCVAHIASSAANDGYVTGDLNCSPSVEM